MKLSVFFGWGLLQLFLFPFMQNFILLFMVIYSTFQNKFHLILTDLHIDVTHKSINIKFIIPQICLSFRQATLTTSCTSPYCVGYNSIIGLFLFIAESYLMCIYSSAGEDLCCFQFGDFYNYNCFVLVF